MFSCCRSRLAKLLRVVTSSSPEAPISLDEYVARMKEGQKNIYFIAGANKDEVSKSPFAERLVKKVGGIEGVIRHVNQFNTTTTENQLCQWPHTHKALDHSHETHWTWAHISWGSMQWHQGTFMAVCTRLVVGGGVEGCVIIPIMHAQGPEGESFRRESRHVCSCQLEKDAGSQPPIPEHFMLMDCWERIQGILPWYILSWGLKVGPSSAPGADPPL